MAQAITTLRCVFTVGGAEIPELAVALVELDIVTRENKPARCMACFTASPAGGDVLDRQILDFGGWIKVSRGGARLFSGRIVALGLRRSATAPPVLQMVAEDALLGLSGIRRTRTFTDVSDTDILYRIASDHGLQADVELSGPTMKAVAQVATTDLDFLVERLQRLDARMWVEESTLHVRPRRIQPAAAVRMSIGRDLHEFSVLADVRGQHGQIAVVGWDVAGKVGLEAVATDADLGTEAQDGDTGGEIQSRAFTDSTNTEARRLASTWDEAHAWARAAFRREARRFVSGQGITELDGRISPGASVDIQGLGRSFSGAYLVTGARHRFDSTHGYRTEFSAERPALGRV